MRSGRTDETSRFEGDVPDKVCDLVTQSLKSNTFLVDLPDEVAG